MDIRLLLQNASQEVYEPVLLGSVTWETQRRGQPGKLTFTMLADSRMKVEEGNAVRLDVGITPVFFGFIFERSWGSDGQVKVTAYDQLRYLKNKSSYQYENKTAGDVVRMVAEDFQLSVGELEDTGYPIDLRREKDKTLWDVILNAIDITMTYTKELYILYDDAGKLTLRNIGNMKVDLMMDKDTALDYDYKSSIDGDTYNQIRLYYDNKETGKRDVYMTRDKETINKWGILQYDETLQDASNGQAAAEAYLSLYNQPSRSLSIKGAFGEIKVRAGCLVPVFLDIRDMQLKNYMLVEQAKHEWNEGIHTMDLVLRGAGINNA